MKGYPAVSKHFGSSSQLSSSISNFVFTTLFVVCVSATSQAQPVQAQSVEAFSPGNSGASVPGTAKSLGTNGSLGALDTEAAVPEAKLGTAGSSATAPGMPTGSHRDPGFFEGFFDRLKAAVSSFASTIPNPFSAKGKPGKKISFNGPYRSMEGGLVLGKRRIPQLNSNHPEIITSIERGNIAVSTLAGTPSGLDYRFEGPFAIFSSNQNRSGRTLYQTVAFRNPSDRPVRVIIDSWAATDTSQAPYADSEKGPDGKAFTNRERVVSGVKPNGPGQYNAALVLTEANQIPTSLRTIVIPPGGVAALPARPLGKGLELVTQGRLRSDGPIEAAILYNTEKVDIPAIERQLLTGRRIETSGHDPVPTPVGAAGPMIFGRVAGVVETAAYEGRMSNSAGGRFLVDGPDETSFAFNTKRGTDLGTGRNEAARMEARYENAAYESPLNYGSEIRLSGTFANISRESREISIFIDSPIKSNDSRVLRGTFEITVTDPDTGRKSVKTVSVSQTQQTRSRLSLADLRLAPGQEADVTVRTVYGANNTGPHSLRIMSR